MTTITVYANSNREPSAKTIEEMSRRGLRFSIVSSQNLASVKAARVTQFPTVSAITAAGRVRWDGHHPDYIQMLADLISDGPIPRGGLSDYETATQVVLTREQALQEVVEHQLSTDEFLADCGDAPLYRGSKVLDWLGY